jgi:hypothetical protein
MKCWSIRPTLTPTLSLRERGKRGDGAAPFSLREKVSPKATDEGCLL